MLYGTLHDWRMHQPGRYGVAPIWHAPGRRSHVLLPAYPPKHTGVLIISADFTRPVTIVNAELQVCGQGMIISDVALVGVPCIGDLNNWGRFFPGFVPTIDFV